MSDRLDGRVAIVTGGARGIGAAIARALHAGGASVIVADTGVAIDGRDADPAVAADFAAALGDRAEGFSDDVAEPGVAAALVARCRERFGGIDIVINNAAILRDAFVFRGKPEDWDKTIANNLSAAYYLIAAATPVMRDQAKSARGATEEAPGYHWGRIVNMVSTAAYYGNFGQAAYGASKGGLTALMRVTAHDMARAGVSCNAVVPFAHTRVTDMIVPQSDEQAAYKMRALKATADHVGAFIAYICSPAAQSVSGQIFGVRGREVFLFSQPRPVATITAAGAGWDIDGLARAVEDTLKDSFAALVTDLEAFNTDPVV
jgi:NAD(P)-dependent dehydrogenase (short-subunit alcohol dehydrogenase family)